MFLLFIAWPFVEIYLFVKVVERYGFFNAFMATLTAFFFGLLIIKAQGRTLLMNVQSELAQGKVPARSMINSALLFIGGFFILLPGFFSDVMGLLLILPGTRHIFSLYVRTYLARKISNGTFRVFNGGFGAGFGMGGPSQGFGRTQGPVGRSERDVTPQVIDVKPISSTEERE